SRTMRDRKPARSMEPWTWPGPSLSARSPTPTESKRADVCVCRRIHADRSVMNGLCPRFSSSELGNSLWLIPQVCEAGDWQGGLKTVLPKCPAETDTTIKPTIYPYRDEFPPQMRSSATLSSRNVGPFSERRRMPSLVQDWLAERAGFEPAIQFPVYGISNAAPSATRPPLLLHPPAPGAPRRAVVPWLVGPTLRTTVLDIQVDCSSSSFYRSLSQASEKLLQQLLAFLL